MEHTLRDNPRKKSKISVHLGVNRYTEVGKKQNFIYNIPNTYTYTGTLCDKIKIIFFIKMTGKQYLMPLVTK